MFLMCRNNRCRNQPLSGLDRIPEHTCGSRAFSMVTLGAGGCACGEACEIARVMNQRSKILWSFTL